MGFSVNGGSTTVRDALHRTLPVPREVRYTIMYNSPRERNCTQEGRLKMK
jgi:hypothetical protein